MQVNRSIWENVFRGLFVVLPVLYFLLYFPAGFDDSDAGFIPALAARIRSGDIPYWSFTYARPPLSPLLNAAAQALLPAHPLHAGGIQAVAELWFIALFTTLALNRHYKLQQYGISPALFACAAFVMSAHNFTLMPWHTVDGLFFSAAGICLLSWRGHALHLAGGGMLLVLAVLCKQNFLAVLPVGAMLAGSLYDWRKGVWLGIGIGLLLGLLIVIPAWFWPEWAAAAWEQMGGSAGDLLYAGLWKYVLPLVVWVLPLLAALFLLPRWLGFEHAHRPLVWMLGAWLLLITGAHAALSLWRQTYLPPLWGWSQALLWLGAGLCLFGWFRRDARVYVLAALLAVAWTGGISWGYPVPLLMGGPLLFAFVWMVVHELHRRIPLGMQAAVLAWLTLCFGILRLYPYRDAPAWACTHDLGGLHAPFAGIRTGPENYARYAELKQLAALYPAFEVLPSMPLAHVMTGTRPVLPTVWEHDAEIAWAQTQESLLNRLEFQRPAIFLERGKMQELDADGPYRCSLARYVRDHWRLTRKGVYFYIYEK